jgi:hypothetical protein
VIRRSPAQFKLVMIVAVLMECRHAPLRRSRASSHGVAGPASSDASSPLSSGSCTGVAPLGMKTVSCDLLFVQRAALRLPPSASPCRRGRVIV